MDALLAAESDSGDGFDVGLRARARAQVQAAGSETEEGYPQRMGRYGGLGFARMGVVVSFERRLAQTS